MRPLTESQLRRMAKRSYMNERQRAFFHRRLLTIRRDTLSTMEELQASLRATVREPDEADQAAQEEEQRLVLRALDRDTRLLDKIDAALRRLAIGDYGYC